MDDYVQSAEPVHAEIYKGVELKFYTYSNANDVSYIYTHDKKFCFMSLGTLEDAIEDAHGEVDGTNKVTQAEVEAAMAQIDDLLGFTATKH